MSQLFCIEAEDWRRIKQLVFSSSRPEWKTIEEIQKIVKKYPKFK